MKSVLYILLLLVISEKVKAQNFEGEIIYLNSYKSKIPNLSNEKLTLMLGSRQEYYICGGNYKSEANGSIINTQLYDYKTNRLFNKTPKSDTLFWIDASKINDTIISYEVKKNVSSILGYACDLLTIKTKYSTSMYYYTESLALDKGKYINHNFGNWAFYTSKTGSIPLKIVIANNQFEMESLATEIISLRLDEKYFSLSNKPTAPNLKQ